MSFLSREKSSLPFSLRKIASLLCFSENHVKTRGPEGSIVKMGVFWSKIEKSLSYLLVTTR